MIIWETPYSFIRSNSSLVFLICSILSAKTGPLVCVNKYFLEGDQKMFFFNSFSSKVSSGDAGHSVYSSVMVIELNCLLQIIKDLSPFDNTFATESVLEKSIETVRVLVVEADCIHFL